MSLFQRVLYGQDLRHTGEFSDLPDIEQNFLKFSNELMSSNFCTVAQCIDHLFGGQVDLQKYESASQLNKKQFIMLLSMLVPLHEPFFPAGYCPDGLHKISTLLNHFLKIFKKQSMDTVVEDVSGQKLSIYLKECYWRVHERRVKYAKKCQQYEIRVRELEQKISQLRQNGDTSAYNISFAENQDPLEHIRMVTSQYAPSEQLSSVSTEMTSNLKLSQVSLQPSLILNIILMTLLVSLAVYTFL